MKCQHEEYLCFLISSHQTMIHWCEKCGSIRDLEHGTQYDQWEKSEWTLPGSKENNLQRCYSKGTKP